MKQFLFDKVKQRFTKMNPKHPAAVLHQTSQSRD